MKTTTTRLFFSMIALGLIVTGTANAGSVFFDFINAADDPNAGMGHFDSAFAGSTMTRDESGTENPITIKTLEVKTPNYVSGVWDLTYNIGSKTNIPGNDYLAIDNQVGGGTPFGSESSYIHPEESWTIEFDVPVVFNQIDFDHFSDGAAGDLGRITVDGITVLDFNSSHLDDNKFDDPFGVGTVIPAGTNITIKGIGQGAGDVNSSNPISRWKIDSFTVTEVPEPSSIILLLFSGLAATFAYRRK